jgi:5-formyltetrahydrofolate cyclo-ligase
VSSAADLKKQIRQQGLKLRSEFKRSHADADERLSRRLVEGLSALRSFGGLWVGYRAVRDEADPACAIQTLGGRWAYPKVSGDRLEFYLTDQQSSWDMGRFGIPEPDPANSKHIDIHHAEGVLVPGTAFDRGGNRVGSGRAYYDRALAGFKGCKVAVAYSVQIRDEEWTREAHDIGMDYIATEEEFLAVKGQ